MGEYSHDGDYPLAAGSTDQEIRELRARVTAHDEMFASLAPITGAGNPRHDRPPLGYAACTRPDGHDGPCAHPLIEPCPNCGCPSERFDGHVCEEYQIHMEMSPMEFRDHLDACIRQCRKERDEAVNIANRHMAECYVDAYQSMRTSLFGELLP